MKEVKVPFHLFIALARCSMANNPTNAIKQQIARTAKLLKLDGYIDEGERLDNLMDAEANSDDFKIVHSKSPNK